MVDEVSRDVHNEVTPTNYRYCSVNAFLVSAQASVTCLSNPARSRMRRHNTAGEVE